MNYINFFPVFDVCENAAKIIFVDRSTMIHVNGDRPPCTGFVSTPNCKKKCEIGYTASYGEDKHYDKKAYSIAQNLDEIRREMVENGLVEAVFTIYENLLRYEWVN